MRTTQNNLHLKPRTPVKGKIDTRYVIVSEYFTNQNIDVYLYLLYTMIYTLKGLATVTFQSSLCPGRVNLFTLARFMVCTTEGCKMFLRCKLL